MFRTKFSIRLGPLYSRILLILFVILCMSLVLQVRRNQTLGIESLLASQTNRLDRALEAEILRDLNYQQLGLGDYGAAVKLDGEAGERGNRDTVTYSMNIEISKKLSYDRKPPDPRHPLCKPKEKFYNIKTNASVIIVFYNEPFSVLVRTIHSVLNTVKSNPDMLAEIIVVDDHSDLPELLAKFEYYINTRLPRKVKLLRLPER